MNPNVPDAQQPLYAPAPTQAQQMPQQPYASAPIAANPQSLLSASGYGPQQNQTTAQTPPVAGTIPMPLPPAAEMQTPTPPMAQAPAGSAPLPTVNPGVKQPVTQPNPNSTQNMLQIAEIRDGIVIMNDGSFRSVVMVKSINFDLMSRAEQEAVEFSFQAFLNSLYFPIQIFIRSQKVDMGPYIQRLDKVRSEHDNMLLALLMDDYVDFIEAVSQQTNIMDKRFYIVIPFFPKTDAPQKTFTQSKNLLTGFTALFSKNEQHVVINEADLEKAKSELRNRVQTVLDGLLQSNIQSLPLDTQELIELYYDTYNPDTATRQQLKNFQDMSADIVTKGQGAAVQPQLNRELTA